MVIYIEMSICFLKLCANGSPRICKFVGQYCLVFDQIDRVPFILIQSRLDHFIQLISQPLLGFVFAFHQLQHLNPLCFVEMLLVKRDLSRLAEQNQSGNDPILKPVGQHILVEEREIIADYIKAIEELQKGFDESFDEQEKLIDDCSVLANTYQELLTDWFCSARRLNTCMVSFDQKHFDKAERIKVLELVKSKHKTQEGLGDGPLRSLHLLQKYPKTVFLRQKETT